jgi:hypothetical protein
MRREQSREANRAIRQQINEARAVVGLRPLLALAPPRYMPADDDAPGVRLAGGTTLAKFARRADRKRGATP